MIIIKFQQILIVLQNGRAMKISIIKFITTLHKIKIIIIKTNLMNYRKMIHK